MTRRVLVVGFGLSAGALLLVIAVLVVALLAASGAPQGSPPGLADAGADVCSENPAYAEALVALDWLGSSSPGADQHRRLRPRPARRAVPAARGRGATPPRRRQAAPSPPARIPPCACALTRTRTSTASLAAGQTVTVYGRSADMAWWYVDASPVWGWVRAEDADLQAGADENADPEFRMNCCN